MMEITLTSPTTTTKSPEEEMETPPRVLIHPIKPITFTNGVLKRTSPNRNPSPVHGNGHYKECLKNHAATIGGHALDGCGEFMPAPTVNPLDPTSLKCAACGCHRNFHRREPEERVATPVIEYHPQHRHHPLPPPGANPVVTPLRNINSNNIVNNMINNHQTQTTSGSQSPPPISSSYAPHMLLALSHQQQDSGAGGERGVVLHSLSSPTPTPTPPSRKRYRTKFTQDQKDKMYDFAEKVGWKMHKSNEDMVNGFCNDIGVERGVFKVWMHNNKNTFGKRSNSSGGNGNDNGINLGVNVNGSSSDDVNYHHDHHQEEDEVDHHHQLQQEHHHDHHQQYNGINTNGSVISNINNPPPTNGSSSS